MCSTPRPGGRPPPGGLPGDLRGRDLLLRPPPAGVLPRGRDLVHPRRPGRPLPRPAAAQPVRVLHLPRQLTGSAKRETQGTRMRLCPIPGVYEPCPGSKPTRLRRAPPELPVTAATGYLTTILPGLKLPPGSMAENNPSIMCTPGAEMSCSSHGACSVPTAWWCDNVPSESTNACCTADFTLSYWASGSTPSCRKANVK